MRGALPQVWVLELSSFQLDAVRRLRADCGHRAEHHAGPPRLAWRHGRLCRRQGAHLRRATPCWSLNRDDRVVMARCCRDAGEPVRGRQASEQRGARDASAPTRRSGAGDFGLESRTAWPGWSRAPRPRRRASAARTVAAGAADCCQRLMPADALRIRGRHNAANALAALALAAPIGCRSRRCCTACANTAASRTASSCRASIDGVEYFDDSKGTNVGATVAALTASASRAPQARADRSAATARARTSRRWPRRSRATRARCC